MSEERYQPTRLEWLVLSIETKIPMLLSQMRMLRDLKTVDDVRVFFSSQVCPGISAMLVTQGDSRQSRQRRDRHPGESRGPRDREQPRFQGVPLIQPTSP